MKDDISSYESCNPRTHSLDIELEDLSESEGAAQGDPTPELLNEVFEFRDPELVQLDEMEDAEEAFQGHPGRAHLNESFKFRDPEQLNERSGFREAAQTDTELAG